MNGTISNLFDWPRRSAALAVLAVAAVGLSSPAPGADLTPRYVPAKPAQARVWPGLRDDAIIVKFVEGSEVRARSGRLVSMAKADLTNANRILTERAGLTTARLFSRPEISLDLDRAEAQAASGRELADLNNYYLVKLDNPGVAAAEQLINELNALPEVEIAYAQPIPEPAVMSAAEVAARREHEGGASPVSAAPPFGGLGPGTPDFESMQGYLGAAPTGVDAYAAWTYAGGRGETVKVIDVELGWNWTHEDMKTPFFQGGEEAYSDHGIAVTGEFMGQDNGYGITGIANNVEAGCHSVWNVPPSDAFDIAISQLDAGDIFIIELHCPGPDGPYIALEYWQACFDVISMGTARGVICLQAAGNGSADFDDPRYEGRFDRSLRDSGSIIVGATDGADLDPAYFTNHGERVDLAGWGWDVVTTGYGDLQGGPQDEWYTSGFSGTSSATPIITGTVACMQGIWKAQSGGVPLDGQAIAQVLKATGTPTNGPQLIGPRPNLALAVPALLGDLTAITGVVTDADTSLPLEGVQMRIVEFGTRVETEADGSYELPVLPGTVTVRATMFGYDTDETSVDVTGPAADTTYNLAMNPTPTIELTGAVRDENGNGVVSAEVTLLDTPLSPVYTGAGGYYAVPNVPTSFEGMVTATAADLTPDVRWLDAGNDTTLNLRLAAPIDFEGDNGGFAGSSDWQWGVPDFDEGPDAHSGQRCWGTNLAGHYNGSSDDVLTTPYFDLAGLDDPRLAMWHWYSVWAAYDGINVEVQPEGGSWQILEPVGGYPEPCIDAFGYNCEPGWTGSTHAWAPVAFDLNAFAGDNVRFRFTLASYGYTGSPGWYIDDLQVHGAGAAPCPWDVNGDFSVDIDDVFGVLSHWGEGPGQYDVNDDGAVDIDDVFEILANWGPCP